MPTVRKHEYASHAESEPSQSTLLGLDRPQSVFAKLWSTFVLGLMGALLGLVYLIWGLVEQSAHPVLARLLRFVVDGLSVFVLLAFVFVWYQPTWLRRSYISAERGAYRVSVGVHWLFIGAFVIVAVWGVVENLRRWIG